MYPATPPLYPLTSQIGRTAIQAETTVQLAVEALENTKADDLRLFDVRGRSDLTDYVLLASGSAAPHLRALTQSLQADLKAAGAAPARISGDPDSGWIVVDCIDVVIHVFDPPTRAYYALESLWPEGPIPVPPSR